MCNGVQHEEATFMAGHTYIGTSGWSFPAWLQVFCEGCLPTGWLRFCASRFTPVEVNAAFYRLQRVSTFRQWWHQNLADFRFAIKINRYLTHNQKLRDPLP